METELVSVAETRTGFQFELGKPEPLALAHKFSAVGIDPDLRFEEKKSKNSELYGLLMELCDLDGALEDGVVLCEGGKPCVNEPFFKDVK
nr:hypothetical protein Iba_chr11eCG11280 [Ipomoea batatas]